MSHVATCLSNHFVPASNGQYVRTFSPCCSDQVHHVLPSQVHGTAASLSAPSSRARSCRDSARMPAAGTCRLRCM